MASTEQQTQSNVTESTEQKGFLEKATEFVKETVHNVSDTMHTVSDTITETITSYIHPTEGGESKKEESSLKEEGSKSTDQSTQNLPQQSEESRELPEEAVEDEFWEGEEAEGGEVGTGDAAPRARPARANRVGGRRVRGETHVNRLGALTDPQVGELLALRAQELQQQYKEQPKPRLDIPAEAKGAFPSTYFPPPYHTEKVHPDQSRINKAGTMLMPRFGGQKGGNI